MNKTWAYLKEILKTTAKVILIAGVTYFFAAPFALGFTATLFNAMTAGQVAGAVVTCLGGYAAIKTAVKDALTMHERIEKKQREKHVDEELTGLKKEIKKLKPQKNPQVKGKEDRHKTPQTRTEKTKKKFKFLIQRIT